MKYIFFILFASFSLSLAAQSEVDFLNAIGKGDLSSLNTYMSNNVTLCIDDSQDKLDKSTAISKIQSFFDGKNVEKYKLLHNGKSPDNNSSYRVARIHTAQGTFRVFAYSEEASGASKVIEVRIDKM